MGEINILRKMILWGSFFIMLMIAMLGGCSYLNKKMGLPQDNMIEEFVEEVIETQTGIPVDLTP